jgi:hypothetical protein
MKKIVLGLIVVTVGVVLYMLVITLTWALVFPNVLSFVQTFIVK